MKFLETAVFAFTVLVLMCVPWLAPSNTLFGVRTGAAFRATREGRKSIMLFLSWLGAVLPVGVAIAWAVPLTSGFVIQELLALALFFRIWVRLNRRLKKFALPPQPAEIDLSASDRMPKSKWLSLVPLAMLAATAIYLHQNWSRIPERFPIHWGMDGQPNGWAARTIGGVYGILILMAALLLWLILLNTVLWFGARRSHLREATFNIVVIVQFALAVAPCYIALLPLFGPSPLLMLLFVLAPIAVALLYGFRQAAKPLPADADLTPESAWTGGLFYFNREDPALAVPRRDGFGYSPNFAHPTSWFLMLAPLGIIAAASAGLF